LAVDFRRLVDNEAIDVLAFDHCLGISSVKELDKAPIGEMIFHLRFERLYPFMSRQEIPDIAKGDIAFKITGSDPITLIVCVRKSLG